MSCDKGTVVVMIHWRNMQCRKTVEWPPVKMLMPQINMFFNSVCRGLLSGIGLMPYVSGLGISRRATNWGADGSYTYIYMYISKIRSDVTVFRERSSDV